MTAPKNAPAKKAPAKKVRAKAMTPAERKRKSRETERLKARTLVQTMKDSARTPEGRERILAALRVGAPISMACEAGSISYSGLQAWRRDDPALDAEIRHLQALKGIESLRLIEQAAQDPKHWTAAAWYLERQYPEQFGRKNISMELTGKNGGPITLEAGPIREKLDTLSVQDLESLMTSLPGEKSQGE